MSNKKKLIPELRFPEFKKEGEWKIRTIDELCDILNNIRKPITSIERIKGSYPYYGASGIIDFVDDYLFDEKLLLIGEDGAKWGAYENTAFLVEGKYWVNNHAHVLKPKLINEKLLESYLVKLNLSPYITGAAPPKLTLGKLKEIPVPFPENDKEQKKIASCLSSLDDVISAQTQKLDLLKEHKKGLMQNLFPQEGEKVPKYRFKEFEKDGDWVKTQLGHSATFINGRAYKQEELLESGKYRVLRVGNFFTNNNWYYSDLQLEENKYCDDGDLLYAWSASFGPRIWRGEKVIYHYHIWKVVPAKSISKDFLFVMLDNETLRMKNQNANGFALLHITKGTIENWECSIPKSKSEQQKIASCLSSLDALITAQEEKVEQLKIHKKGLMQGLFPKIKE